MVNSIENKLKKANEEKDHMQVMAILEQAYKEGRAEEVPTMYTTDRLMTSTCYKRPISERLEKYDVIDR